MGASGPWLQGLAAIDWTRVRWPPAIFTLAAQRGLDKSPRRPRWRNSSTRPQVTELQGQLIILAILIKHIAAV